MFIIDRWSALKAVCSVIFSLIRKILAAPRLLDSLAQCIHFILTKDFNINWMKNHCAHRSVLDILIFKSLIVICSIFITTYPTT